MFYQATNFNQNLSSWNTCGVQDAYHFDYQATSWNENNKPKFLPCENNQPTTNYFESNWGHELTSICLPLYNGGKYNFTAYWGDGGISKVTSYTNRCHTYPSSGTYTIRIQGQIEGFRFNNGGDRSKLINITKWGPLRLGNLGGYFYGASNLADITDTPNLTGTTNFYQMFRGATKFNSNINNTISGWDTSPVTDMREMFRGATNFNQNLSSWNTAVFRTLTVLITRQHPGMKTTNPNSYHAKTTNPQQTTSNQTGTPQKGFVSIISGGVRTTTRYAFLYTTEGNTTSQHTGETEASAK